MEINETVVRRVLEVVDQGLSNGLGSPTPGNMCVEAAVCYALGLPHGDDPQCVSKALRSLKIRLNDSAWSSKEARANGMRRLAVAQLGSKGLLDDKDFARRVAELSIRKSVPIALRAAASIQKDSNHKAALLLAADRCEKDGTREATLEAKKAASASASDYAASDYAAYAAAASAAASAYAAADYAASAADYAASASDYAAADYAAAAAADYAAYAASASAASAADYAAYAAAASASASDYAAKKIARDKVLANFAEDVVGILIEMKAPGCQWLWLTEVEQVASE